MNEQEIEIWKKMFENPEKIIVSDEDYDEFVKMLNDPLNEDQINKLKQILKKMNPNVIWTCPQCKTIHQWIWNDKNKFKGKVKMNCNSCSNSTEMLMIYNKETHVSHVIPYCQDTF